MSERKLYVVRHGQASLGAADYDNLSALGAQQGERLGAYFAQQGVVFDAAYTGTLRRHAQTYAAILQGAAATQNPDPTGLSALSAKARLGLNEYDSEAVITANFSPEQLAHLHNPLTPSGYKAHFVMLRQGIAAWMRGETQPRGMPTYTDFAQGVMSVLDEIRQSDAQNILVVSSGGPLSSAVAQVLGLDHVAGIELNMRMRNTSVTEFVISPKRYALLSYNTLPHLDDSIGRKMVTYA